MKPLFFALYFMGLGWAIRKTGLDARLMIRIDQGIDAIATRAGSELASAFTSAMDQAMLNGPLPDEDPSTPAPHDTRHGK